MSELGNGRTLLIWNDTRGGGGIHEGSLCVRYSGFSLVEGMYSMYWICLYWLLAHQSLHPSMIDVGICTVDGACRAIVIEAGLLVTVLDST